LTRQIKEMRKRTRRLSTRSMNYLLPQPGEYPCTHDENQGCDAGDYAVGDERHKSE
jgi:hypothetical protein